VVQNPATPLKGARILLRQSTTSRVHCQPECAGCRKILLATEFSAAVGHSTLCNNCAEHWPTFYATLHAADPERADRIRNLRLVVSAGLPVEAEPFVDLDELAAADEPTRYAYRAGHCVPVAG
jgi:hypothetical protein